MPVASPTPERPRERGEASSRERKPDRTRLWRRWGEYLFAILGGNVVYLLVEPDLPQSLRHQIFRIDWGLGLDFAICAALYGLVRALRS